MSATSTIAIVVVTIGTSAAFGVAHQKDWGDFGELGQSITSAPEICEAPISVIAWSSGVSSKSIAQTRALVKWSKKARRHGLAFASWHNARGRDMTCNTRSLKVMQDASLEVAPANARQNSTWTSYFRAFIAENILSLSAFYPLLKGLSG